MPTKRVTRDGVFVSYSHVDKKWLERLKVHLKPLERDHQIVIWNDTKLRSGDKWRVEINKALSTPKVAILLVSADFLASDFIHQNELPPLLEASEQEGLIILPVLIGSCSFTNSPLGQFQAVNDPRQPLNLLTDGQVDEVFSQLFNRVLGIFSTSAPTLKPARKTGSRTAQTNQTPTKIALKTTRSPAATPSTKAVKKEPSVDRSPRASSTKKGSSHALLVKQTGEWEIVPVSQSQIGQSAQLSLLPATATQRAFLTSLRQGNNLASLVLGLETYLCRLQSLTRKTEGQLESWHLEATLVEFNHQTELTVNSITPDMQAEARAKILLLDEEATQDVNRFYYINIGSRISIEESPFPALFQQIKQPGSFRQAATLVATWYLHMNNIVEHILKLDLQLKGKQLKVQFEGQRSAYYQERPTIIRVTGLCDLSRPIQEQGLRLGPANRY